MRLALMLAVAMLLAAPAAHAADGYRAKFTVTMQFSDEFYKLAAKQGEDGAELDPESLRMQPVNGLIYFSGSAVRLDMNVPSGVMSTIVRQPEQLVYLIDHTSRTAWQVDLSGYAQSYQESGLPVLNPEEVFLHWDEVLAQLKQLKGLSYKDLGRQTVNGVPCHGLRYSGRIEDVLKSGGVAVLPGLEPFKDLKGPWRGEYWLDERSGLPVKMHSVLLGIDYLWEITDLQAWDVSPALFMVPRGYRVQQFDLTALPE
jgi:hypothetical protein